VDIALGALLSCWTTTTGQRWWLERRIGLCKGGFECEFVVGGHVFRECEVEGLAAEVAGDAVFGVAEGEVGIYVQAGAGEVGEADWGWRGGALVEAVGGEGEERHAGRGGEVDGGIHDAGEGVSSSMCVFEICSRKSWLCFAGVDKGSSRGLSCNNSKNGLPPFPLRALKSSGMTVQLADKCDFSLTFHKDGVIWNDGEQCECIRASYRLS